MLIVIANFGVKTLSF